MKLFDLEVFMQSERLASRHEGGPTYVYAVHCDPHFIKVGVSWELTNRLSNIMAMNPHPTRVIETWQFNSRLGAILAERAAHRFLRPHHHRGEWFVIDPDTVVELMTDINRHMPALLQKHWSDFAQRDAVSTGFP